MLLGHRYYDASTGRFLNRDPEKSGRNWYSYCAQNPRSGLDPSGLLTLFGFQFDEDTVGSGLSTGLDGAVSGLTGGLYDGGGSAGNVGFGGAQNLGKGALILLATAAGVAALPTVTGLLGTSGTISAGGGAAGAAGSRLYRVVEEAEENDLISTGGILNRSPSGQELKPFWTTVDDAASYQNSVPPSWGSTNIWQWQNPAGVGEPGPSLDGSGSPTWHVPYSELADIPPGRRL